MVVAIRKRGYLQVVGFGARRADVINKFLAKKISSFKQNGCRVQTTAGGQETF